MTVRRFRGTPTRAPGAGVNVTIRMTPVARTTPCPPAGTGNCTPAITGIQWCLYDAPPDTLVSDSGDPPTYTLTPTTEVPTCSSDPIAIILSGGGYPPTDQDGYYIFSLAGESCGCVPEWSYQFAQDATPTWSDLAQPYIAGTQLVVPFPGSGTYAKGVATISAVCNGVAYGPVTITLSSAY